MQLIIWAIEVTLIGCVVLTIPLNVHANVPIQKKKKMQLPNLESDLFTGFPLLKVSDLSFGQ